MKVEICRIDKDLPLPVYQTEGSVACDLYARLATEILPKSLHRIPANVIIHTPPGYMFIIASRSSTPFRKGLMIANGIGIGDQDFWGPEDEYQIPVYNITDEVVKVERGERLAQGIFVPIEKVVWVEVDKIDEQNRGMFGSTGHTTKDKK